METICVNLYGNGSRDSRLRAEYVNCGRAEECSAYKNGKCFCVTTPFGIRCPIGNVNIVDGGTKQSKMFRRVWAEAKEHPAYAKLKYPNHNLITRIGNDAFLTITYTWLEEVNGNIYCHDPHLMTNKLMTSADNLTPENIKRICESKPCAIMGGVIKDYQEKVIPMFLHQLQKCFPEKYSAFLKDCPDYVVKAPNWVGRRAKLATCNRNATYKDAVGNEFRFDGEYLVCDRYNSSFTPFRAKAAKVQICVSDEMEVEITDNNQVLDDTVFL